MKRPILVLLLLGLPSGCSSHPQPPEHLGRKLAIMPVHNRTGEPLVVSGDGILDRYVFHSESATVSEILAAETDFQLREKGFDVATSPSEKKALLGRIPENPTDAAELAAQAGLGPLCLYLEIRRWEPDGRAHVNFVIVDLEASLMDTATRHLVWKYERRGPIATPGEFLLEAAYIAAARKVTAEILAPLHPDPSVPR
jgi:hypothetical protein